jgi:lipopolysaccharide transport system permease protein
MIASLSSPVTPPGAGDDALRPARVIRRRTGLIGVGFAELWRYRELFGFLIWRDILVRYKQTYLGILWAVIQPFMMMVIFTLVMGRAGKFPSYGFPYPLITFAALLPWQFFSTALTDGSVSLIAASNMISKVYFPRLIIPTAAVFSGTVDFCASFVVLLGIQAWYRVPLRPEILLLPLFFFMAVVVALAAAVWFSSLSVKYRDVKYLVPFITRIGLIACPVSFISSVVPTRWRFVYSLNPLVGVIDGFRWCILGPVFRPDWLALGLSLALTFATLSMGLVYFRTTERRFADVI